MKEMAKSAKTANITDKEDLVNIEDMGNRLDVKCLNVRTLSDHMLLNVIIENVSQNISCQDKWEGLHKDAMEYAR